MDNQSPWDDEDLDEQPRRPVQFSIRFLLLIMLLASLLAAIGAGLARSNDVPDGAFVILAVVAPVGMMILFSFVEGAAQLLAQYRSYREQRRRSRDEEP